MIRILQHRHKCIGCNACVEADKYRWRISKKDGKSTLIGGSDNKGWFSVIVEVDELEFIKAAEKHCPVNIIRWLEV
ncbi:MAG: ferredoxin [Flavobacteriia bacterium]|jgi:ferredoxin